MWDEQRDREMMRNQMIAIVLMTGLLIVWFTFFMPAPPVQPPAQQTDTPFDRAQTFETPVPAVDEAQDVEDEWPYLPPIPTAAASGQDDVTLRDELLELTFTRIGARLKSAIVFTGESGDDVQLVPQAPPDIADTEVIYPLGLRFTDEKILDELDRRRFEYEIADSGRTIIFTLELGDAALIRKTFSLSSSPHVLDVTIDIENHQSRSRVMGMDTTPAYGLNWGPSLRRTEADKRFRPTFVWYNGVEAETFKPSDLPEEAGVPTELHLPDAAWTGYKTKYFLASIKPSEAEADVATRGWAIGTEDNFRFGFSVPRFELAPGETHSSAFRVYVGPMELGSLAAAWDGLESALSFFQMFAFMDWFAKALLTLLNWFNGNVYANYGVAIILLTLVVRTAMLPLTLKGMRSMKRMQALAPEIEELREQYKDDQQMISKKMMELYRERGVNPLGGCLPLFLQMPVFIALYRMLWNAYELRGAPFLWVEDLSQPDALFDMPFMENVPFVGQFLGTFNLLPILMGIAMVINVKVMPTSAAVQNPQQKMIMTIMPVMFSVICYNLAAGLNLYVLTSTILGMAQQPFIRAGSTEKVVEKVKKRQDTIKKRKQHFYTRAKEHQRNVSKTQKGKKKKDASKKDSKSKVNRKKAG